MAMVNSSALNLVLIYTIKEIKKDQEEVEGSHPGKKSQSLPQLGPNWFSIPEPSHCRKARML